MIWYIFGCAETNFKHAHVLNFETSSGTQQTMVSMIFLKGCYNGNCPWQEYHVWRIWPARRDMVSMFCNLGLPLYKCTWSFSLVYITKYPLLKKKQCLLLKRNQCYINSKCMGHWSVLRVLKNPQICSKTFLLYVYMSKEHFILISVILGHT